MKDYLAATTQERFDALMIPGVRRFIWARDHTAKFEHAMWGESDSPGHLAADYRGEQGQNIYPFLIQHLLYTAARTSNAAISLLEYPLGASPVELLLRGTLLASAKALYLLSPTEQSEREERTEALYKGDRYQYELAIWTQEVLNDSTAERPKGSLVRETTVIRRSLDYLVERGNCTCGSTDCPQHDLQGLRSRIMGWWNLYSAVSHANIWHLESSSVLAPSGEARTTGELSQACYDIGWLHAEAVAHCLHRFDLGDLAEPLVIGEDES